MPTDIQGFIAHLEEKGLSASTIRLAYLIVAGLFSSALDSDLIARTPCRGIKLPPRTQTEMRFLTAKEVADVANAIDAPYRALVLTAAYTGCRFGELAGLRVRRLDLLRRSLTVAETLSDLRGQGEPGFSQDGGFTSSGGVAEVPERGACPALGPVAARSRWVCFHITRGRTVATHELPEASLAPRSTGIGR